MKRARLPRIRRLAKKLGTTALPLALVFVVPSGTEDASPMMASFAVACDPAPNSTCAGEEENPITGNVTDHGPGTLNVRADANVNWSSMWMVVSPGEGVHGNIGQQAQLWDDTFDHWEQLFPENVPLDENWISICGPNPDVTVWVVQLGATNRTLYGGPLGSIPACDW